MGALKPVDLSVRRVSQCHSPAGDARWATSPSRLYRLTYQIITSICCFARSLAFLLMVVNNPITRPEPVLVVGAGPAGSTAARSLARAGVPVRLLDRAQFPRNKPCGGGISWRVVPRFPYLSPALSRIAT